MFPYTQGQTASVSANPCGRNLYRPGLPLIFICTNPQQLRVRFTGCGAKVFPVLVSATSTGVTQRKEKKKKAVNVYSVKELGRTIKDYEVAVRDKQQPQL